MSALLIGSSFAQNRTGRISTGRTSLDFPINFTAKDSIKTSETYWVLVDSKQHYSKIQNLSITLATISGSPSIAVSLEGKVALGDAYTEIVSAVTWTSASNNPVNLVAAAANSYRYYKVKFIASGATQKVKVTGLTFNETLFGFTGNVTLSAGSNLVGSSTSNIALNTNKFTVAGATGNTVIAGTLGVTGATTASGLVKHNAGTVSTGYNFASSTVVGGTGDAITMDFTPDFPTLAAGLSITFIAEAANTTAVTLAIDGGTAKDIKKYGGAIGALVANDIRSGQVVTIVYDGTQWVMMSPKGN